MEKKFYITTAIAYPNGAPHMGHALEIIQADAFARFYRLLGKEVFFQTGTDEHGVKNWQTAEKLGIDVKDFLDTNVDVFKKLYELLNISYDNFIRTTDKEIHYKGAQKLWTELVKSGDLYKKKYKGLYCVGCESFKTEKELVEGKCTNHPTREIEEVEEENYFFKLSKYKDQVIKIISSDEYKVVPESRKNEILSWLKDAKDISFSRPKKSLPWGIPVPEDPKHVMYVWCDALSNYITGVGYGTDQKKFDSVWPCDIHVIGKDILRFHAGFWPAMLLSAKVPLPKELFVHGFLQLSGMKMGKSTGNVVDPFKELDKFGVDPFRFYILGAMPIDSDGDYDSRSVVERINNELIANLANLSYRVLSFTNKTFDSQIKEIDNDNVVKEIAGKFDSIKKQYENRDFRQALSEIMEVSAIGNRYMQDKAPWKMKDDPEKAQQVLGTCVNIVKNLSILMHPIMPRFCEELQTQLNLEDLKWDDLGFELKNHKINEARILISKIEAEDEEPEFPLCLKVAEVVEVKDHPDADKLFVVQIKIGKEKRQLVAGLKNDYLPEELVGKKIIVISNLKHAKLKGIKSEGMLLAADDKEKVKVLEVKDAESGTVIGVEDYSISEKQITIDDFSKVKLKVKGGKVLFDSRVLKAGDEEVKVEVKDGAKVC